VINAKAQPIPLMMSDYTGHAYKPVSCEGRPRDTSVSHTLRKVGDQPSAAHRRDYLLMSTMWTLTTSACGDARRRCDHADPTDPDTSATLTGTSHIGTEGVDLTSAGTGEQQLVIDITSASTGTHLLEGVGGARALAALPRETVYHSSCKWDRWRHRAGRRRHNQGLLDSYGFHQRGRRERAFGHGRHHRGNIDRNASTLSANSGAGLVSVVRPIPPYRSTHPAW